MMLIKYMVAVNADCHVIISKVCGQNEGNISTYRSVFFLPCHINFHVILCELR